MVTDLLKFKAAKEARPQPKISRRFAVRIGGDLLDALCACEKSDLELTLHFDTSPEDATALSTFIYNLRQRTEDRLNGYQRTEGTGDKPAS